MKKIELIEALLATPQALLAPMKKAESGEGERRREVLFYSGAKVARYDWWTDEEYDLSFDLDGADLSRLKAGAPVLNGHSQYQVSDVLGKIENPRRGDKGYLADLVFSNRDEVAGVWQDIEDGILNSVSMGVSIQKLVLKEDDKKSKKKHYMATEWQPYEISVVPMGADPHARFLSFDPRTRHAKRLGEDQPMIQVSVDTGAASKAEEQALAALKLMRMRLAG